MIERLMKMFFNNPNLTSMQKYLSLKNMIEILHFQRDYYLIRLFGKKQS